MIYLQVTDEPIFEENCHKGQKISKVIFLGTQLPKKGLKCFKAKKSFKKFRSLFEQWSFKKKCF